MGELIFSNNDEGKGQRFGNPKKSYSTFCFPRASLYVDAKVNEYADAHFAFNLAPNKMSTSCAACGFGKRNDELRFGKYDRIDESYVTFSDKDNHPYYARVGIQYVPYGNYTRNAIPASLTQLMTQTQAAGATFGYTNPDNGLNFAFYGFSAKNKRDGATKINNVGAQAAYIKGTDKESTQITLGWMNNIANSVNYIVSSTQCCGGTEYNDLNKGYRKMVQGAALSLQHKTTSWDATLQYTTALSKFNSKDIEWKNKGAKPSAALVDAGYRFVAFGERDNRIGASYQISTQAVNLKGNGNNAGLPKQRVQADYTIEVLKNFEMGAHAFWDKDYSKNQGGTGKSSATILVTMSVKLG